MSVKHTLFYLCSHTEVWYADSTDANINRAPEFHFAKAVCEAETCRTSKRQYITFSQASYQERAQGLRIYERDAAQLQQNVKAVLPILRSCTLAIGIFAAEVIEVSIVDADTRSLVLSFATIGGAATTEEKIESVFKFEEIAGLLFHAEKYISSPANHHAAAFYQICVDTIRDVVSDATTSLTRLRDATTQLVEDQSATAEVTHSLPASAATTPNVPIFTATTQQGTQYTTADMKLLMSFPEGREIIQSGVVSDKSLAQAMYLIDEARSALGLDRRVAATVMEDFDRLGPQALDQARKGSLMRQFTRAQEKTPQFLAKQAVGKDQVTRWRDAEGYR